MAHTLFQYIWAQIVVRHVPPGRTGDYGPVDRYDIVGKIKFSSNDLERNLARSTNKQKSKYVLYTPGDQIRLIGQRLRVL